LRRRGEKLLGPARIKISTVHGVKGGQADNVLLLTDISLSAYNSMVNDADDETRVFYVGMTRARENLFLMTPQSNLYFEI
jgi:superfamily I DNA/RNA helicase